VDHRVNIQESAINNVTTKIDSRPGRIFAEVKEDSIKGESVYNATLGIFTSGDYPGLANNIKAFNLQKPSIYSINACADAIDKSGSDGIYVTEIKEEKTGLFPFFYGVRVVVRGRPIYFRNLGTTPVERADLIENMKLDLLDDEISILKASIEKEISKPIKLGEYKNPGLKENNNIKQGDKK
jgi:hypothetical protein